MGKGLPKNVQKQAERANEILKQLQAGQDPNAAVPPAVNTPLAPATPEPPANLPVIPPAVTPEPPATPAPVTPEPPATPPAPVIPAPPACPECAKWQQRYDVLKGKYDAEVPRYAYRVQYLENQIADLNGQINVLKSATPAATPAVPGTPPAATPPVAPTTFISDAMKDNEEFKAFKANFPDIADMVVKVVDTAATKIHQETTQRFTALEGNSVQDRQGKFAVALNAKHPGWQTMGQDPNWAMWLGQKDRYSPKKRLDLLKEANQSMDADTVINLLDDFKADMVKAGIPPSSPSTPATPTPPAVPFVTPPSGPGSAPANLNAVNGPEPVTRSFINQFYQDKARGRYKGKEKEAEAIEAKINAAVSSGKVINK